jgi:thiamine biosynthesis lipoprotein
MGVHVVVGGAHGDELGRIARLFDEWERVFSRFWPASELNRVNASEAPTVLVSPLFARVVQVALDAGRSTGGLVDPTLGVAIEAVGYDRDFPLLEPDGPLGPAHSSSLETVELAGRLLSRPPGVKLDLNGVVKAMAVDRALGLLDGGGFVSAGGDVASRVASVVALPAGGSVRLECGGIATSGTTRRRWTRAGSAQHHLIDPRSGRPSASCWREVTVAAGSCLAADVAAKAAFLLSRDGPDWLDARRLPGRFVGEDGVVANASWRAALADRRVAAAA